MNEPPCPCCSFLGKGLFLPWGDSSTVDDEVDKPPAANEVDDSSGVLSPSDAWQSILSAQASKTQQQQQQQQQIVLVDTHGHPHLERSIQYASQNNEKLAAGNDDANSVVSITCAVSPLDWDDALEYASQSQHILPALGVHPWYLNDILMDNIMTGNDDMGITSSEEPIYEDGGTQNIESYLKWDWLSDLETRLTQHPNLIVGEIGLCKMARFVREFPKALGGKATALQLQKIVFKRQMELAAKLRRPVTVHCVNAHGLLMETLTEILNEAKREAENVSDSEKKSDIFPPAVAMHSFTGTAHHVKELLDFEKRVLYPEQVQSEGRRRKGGKQQQSQEVSNDVLFYFGFSHSVNFIMCTSEKAKRKGIEAVKSIPSNRLLVESDVHASVDVALGTAGAVAYAANARGESLESIGECTTRNGLRFISSLALMK
jgi:TatD DNase family protein